MGFTRVVEAHSAQTCKLGENTRVTYLVCGQDAIMVIEEGEFIIGYGCEVKAASAADMTRARLASELLVRHPDSRLHARRHTLRMVRYVAQTWFASRAKIAAKLRRRQANDDIVKSNLWLTEDPAALRSRLGLPGES